VLNKFGKSDYSVKEAFFDSIMKQNDLENTISNDFLKDDLFKFSNNSTVIEMLMLK